MTIVIIRKLHGKNLVHVNIFLCEAREPCNILLVEEVRSLFSPGFSGFYIASNTNATKSREAANLVYFPSFKQSGGRNLRVNRNDYVMNNHQ